MGNGKSVTTVKALSGFGSALLAAGAVTEAQAAVVNPVGITVDSSYSTVPFGIKSSFGDYFRFSANGNSYGLFGFNDFIGQTLSTGTNIAGIAKLSNTSNLSSAIFKSNLGISKSFDSSSFLVGFETDFGKKGYLVFDFQAFETNTLLEGEVEGSPQVIPLPASLPMMGAGLLALGAAGLRRRRKEKAAA